MAIQMRRGADSDFDASKMLPGEIAVTTDGTRKVYAAFGTNDAKELASKDDVQGLINSFTSVVDREIAEAEQRIESKAETVLGTIPDEYEVVSKKADEAVRTKADAIVCTVSGVTPIATDSSDDYIRNLKVYGKTTQETTSGKNLFDYETHVSNGYVSTIYVEPNRTLYRNAQLGVSANWVLYDTDGNSLGTFIDLGFDSANNPLVLPSNASYIVSTDKKVFSELYIGYDSDTTFEPYTGGIASPSPSYPQPLESKGKWGNLAEIEHVPEYSGDEMNATFDEPYTGTLNFAVITSEGTSQLNVKLYLADGTTQDTSVLLPSAENNVWNNKNIAVANIVSIKLYNVSTPIRIIEKLMIRKGSYSSVADSDYRPYTGQLEIESSVYGKNLLPYPYYSVTNTVHGVTFTDNGDGGISLSGTATGYATFMLYTGVNIFKGKNSFKLLGDYTNVVLNISLTDNNGNSLLNATLSTGGHIIDFDNYPTCKNVTLILKRSENTVVSGTVYPMIVSGETIPTDYEPYKPKQSHISLVSDGLKGIPVTDASLATYTDENGQMWCADEVDLERGVYVQRINSIMFDGTKTYVKNDKTDDDNYLYYLRVLDKKDGAVRYEGVMCDKLQLKTVDEINQGNDFSHSGISVNLINAVYINVGYLMSENTSAEVANVLTENPLTVFYILATPIETPLTASEISSYKALHSNYKVTTVMNDCVANMEVTYNADTETWINNKIEARVASALASLAL